MGGVIGSSRKENHSSKKDRYEASNNPLLFSIPDEVIQWILSYLHHSELLKFDSALTNHRYRKHWLQILHRKISPSYRPEKVFTSQCIISLVIPISNDRIVTTHVDQGYQYEYEYKWFIRVWNIHTGEFKELSGHTSTILQVTEVSENCLFSTSYDDTLRVWNLEIASCERYYNAKQSFLPLKLSPQSTIYAGNGLVLSLGGQDLSTSPPSDLFIWSLYDDLKRVNLGNDFGPFHLLSDYQQDNIPRFFTQSKSSKNLQVWNCVKSICEKEIPETEEVFNFAIFPSSQWHRHHHHRHYSFLQQEEHAPLPEPIDPRVAVITSSTRTLKVWNLLSGDCEVIVDLSSFRCSFVKMVIFRPIRIHHHHEHQHHQDNHHPQLHPINEYAIAFAEMTVTRPNDIHVVHLSDRSIVTFPLPTGMKVALLQFQALSTGRIIASSIGQKIRIFNVFTGQCERMITGHSMTEMELLPNGRYVSNYDDHHCIIWKPVEH
jgi:WD40 repeat protein